MCYNFWSVHFFPSVSGQAPFGIQDAIAIQVGEPTRCAPTTTLKIDDPFPARRPVVRHWLLVVVGFFLYEKLGGGGGWVELKDFVGV